LSRFFVEPNRTTNIWFDEAAQFGLGEALEMLAINNVLGNMSHFNKEVYVSINTSPEHILSGAVANALAAISDCSNIVLEVTEHSDRKSTRLNSSHQIISYAVFCLKKKNCKLVM